MVKFWTKTKHIKTNITDEFIMQIKTAIPYPSLHEGIEKPNGKIYLLVINSHMKICQSARTHAVKVYFSSA
jgi:hypothetical protein